MRFKLFFLSSIFFIAFACKKRESNQVENFCPENFDTEAQILIGNTVNATIESDPASFDVLSPIDYPAAYNYLNTLFFTILNTEPVHPNRYVYDWELYIIRDDSVKTAFFAPGGSLYIYTGLLKFLESEHQLISIIAHEVYYANTEDIPINLREADVINCLDLGDITLGREVATSDALAYGLPSLEFNATQVLQADSFAVHVLCPFLYEPLGIREIITKAQDEEVFVEWLEYRSASINERIDALSEFASGCDLGGVRNEESYQQFVANDLP